MEENLDGRMLLNLTHMKLVFFNGDKVTFVPMKDKDIEMAKSLVEATTKGEKYKTIQKYFYDRERYVRKKYKLRANCINNPFDISIKV